MAASTDPYATALAAPEQPCGADRAGDQSRRLGGWVALAGAALVPVYKVDQLVYALAFSVAAISIWLWGRAFATSVLGWRDVGPFSAVYLGQFVLLALAVPVTGLNRSAAALLGESIGLPWLVLGATALLAGRELRRRGARDGVRAPRIDLLTIFGVGCVSVVLAICSRHLSALGLDTHQHVAWTRQIVEAGFIPLAEPPTRLVDAYPKSFHLLTALWNAAALGLPAGPFVKIMPFLQSALPCLALAELIVADAIGRYGEHTARRWQAIFGLAFFAWAFLAVDMAYPWPDLSGTARFSTNGLLLLPPLLIVAARVHGAPAAARASLAVLPLVGAWALTFNPIAAVQLVTGMFPLLAATWASLRPSMGARAWRGVATGASISCVLAVALAIGDPWIVAQAVERDGRAAALLDRAGLKTLKQAERSGEVTPRDKLVRTREMTTCDGPCVTRALEAAVDHAASLPVRSARAAYESLRSLAVERSAESSRRAFDAVVPLGLGTFRDHAALPYSAVLAAAVVVAARRGIRHRGNPAPMPERLLWAAVIALAAAGMLGDLAARIPAEMLLSSHEGLILIDYLRMAHRHLALGFLWIPLAAAVAVLAGPLASRAAQSPLRPPSRVAKALVLVAVAVWVALPLLARRPLLPMRKNRGFWSPTTLSDVRALRRVEHAIPIGDAVLVPAEHVNVSNWEHWIIPIGETAALLPYGERSYIFNVYLGASFALSWRDLEERACSADAATRRAFLQRWRARWFLVRDPGASSDGDAARRTRFCGEPLERYGVELPAARSDSGLYLFRLGTVP